MSETAEQALAALARDLVEEIAAGRAIEMAADPVLDLDLADHQRDLLELVNWVKPFQRRAPSGTHMEQVRGHQEQRAPGLGQVPGSPGMEHPGNLRTIAGAPPTQTRGFIPEDDWLKGEQEWKAKGEAAWKKHEWKGAKKPKTAQKVNDEISDTITRLQPGHVPAEHRQAYHEAGERVNMAARHLSDRGTQAGQIDQDKVGKAYHELARAHEHIVSHVVPHAQPEHYPEAAQHLQRIAGHMQDLDQAMGANPQSTRKLLGTGKEVMARAGEARRAEPVRQAEEESRRAGIFLDERQAVLGGREAFRKWHATQEWPLAPRFRTPADRLKHADQTYELTARRFGIPPEPEPEPKTGAAAVHPNLGSNLARPPGDTISGHAHAHVPGLFPAQQPDASVQAVSDMRQKLDVQQQERAQRVLAEREIREERLQNAALERQGISPPGTYAPLTDSQFAVHTRNVEKALTAAVNAGMATDQAYTLDGQGQAWEPDRAIAHGEIVREYLDKQVNVPSQRAALFMGGLSGAGKSSLLKHHPDISLKDYAVVNPDDFKEELANRGMVPKVEGLSPMESVTLIHEESVHLANLAAAELQRRGKNLAFDVTMKSRAVTEPRIKVLKANGYHVTAVFVDVPVDKSAERVTKRYRRLLEAYREGTNPLGGRYVPESVIMAGEAEPGLSKARHTFDRLRSQFDRWELYDGSTAGKATLKEKSGPPATPGIMSVEDLIKAGTAKPYTGSTEKEARAAEKGVSAGG